MTDEPPILSLSIAERLHQLPSELRAHILAHRDYVDHVRTIRPPRPDHWYAEQHRTIQTLELAERMASAVARNPQEFVRWAGMRA